MREIRSLNASRSYQHNIKRHSKQCILQALAINNSIQLFSRVLCRRTHYSVLRGIFKENRADIYAANKHSCNEEGIYAVNNSDFARNHFVYYVHCASFFILLFVQKQSAVNDKKIPRFA